MTDLVFEELKSSLLEQIRLLKRFYHFCTSYQNFEFDETGINMDQGENEKNKALKIKDKLIKEINQNFKYTIYEDSTQVTNNTIKLILEYNINKSKKIVKFILSVEKDSFTLELDK